MFNHGGCNCIKQYRNLMCSSSNTYRHSHHSSILLFWYKQFINVVSLNHSWSCTCDVKHTVLICVNDFLSHILLLFLHNFKCPIWMSPHLCNPLSNEENLRSRGDSCPAVKLSDSDLNNRCCGPAWEISTWTCQVPHQ